jgi:hypothetical protein
MSTYAKVSGLMLTIDSYSLKPLMHQVAGELGERKTTVFELHGLGQTGVGEDVTYFPDLQQSLIDAGPVLPLAGTYTFDEFSKHLDTLDWFPDAPDGLFKQSFRNYRRWAIESAALDLMLQQNDTSLADALGLELKPLTFVASMRLGTPSSFEPVKRRLLRYPKMRFKLDPINDWTDELIDKLAQTNAVDTMDFKGFYKGTPIEVKTDEVLYRKIAEKFPNAWLEDPDVTDETHMLLQRYSDRITWDFPIHDVTSINSQAFPSARAVNVKPSRSGPIHELFAIYDYCREQGLTMYSGGQTEIGPGRGQVQYLSALFHPDSPNDIAPASYNSAATDTELPTSPLTLMPKPTGFGLL